MADNNPLPNFDIIADAYTALAAQVPRLNNIAPIQQGQLLQQVLDQNTQILAEVQEIRAEIQDIRTRVSSLEIRAQNTEIRARNTRSRLHPLRDVHTGNVIPDCPGTATAINRLTAASAARILQALQIPVDPAASLAKKREAVRLAFL